MDPMHGGGSSRTTFLGHWTAKVKFETQCVKLSESENVMGHVDQRPHARKERVAGLHPGSAVNNERREGFARRTIRCCLRAI